VKSDLHHTVVRALLIESDWFDETTRDHVFTLLPQSAFHEHEDRMVLVDNLHYFLEKTPACMARQGYDTQFKRMFDRMIDYLVPQQVYISQSFRQLRKELCTGLRSILGKEEIARAIMVQDPNFANHSSARWTEFDVTGPLSVSVGLTIAMCINARGLVMGLLPLRPDSWNCMDEMFGDPLTNAIKLGNMTMLDVIIQQVSTRQLVSKSVSSQHTTYYFSDTHQLRSAFPVEEVVDTAIMHNRPDMVAALLQLYYDQFGTPSNTLANKWMKTILNIGNPSMVRTMYASNIPRKFILDYQKVIRICHIGDYSLVFETLSPLRQNLWSINARQDHLNTALRHKNVAAAAAILDTGRVDINNEIIAQSSAAYNGRRMIAPLDVACLNEDVAMLEFLLRRGANYRRQFAVTLNGQCYYMIRDWAARLENGDFS
jgi:hypothetical protein